ncbi:Ig-like domain-containing protein [Puia dinghuensis]|uniref:Peptidase S74 domain-containing protein n=1 Tax=Puia dinghuensis TaxID=1792502 RepID=A0A8J2UBD1_9BACT|nr:Ig-like domain-containing protein [Puia dinghuensis]GGA92029.1 hypothetical protein GCM10011511_14270 [Puia dinghuensis]
MKKGFWILLLLLLAGAGRLSAQTVVSFRFSLNPPSSSALVAGWISANGDPSDSIISATDPVTGVSISSVSTANWIQNGHACAADGIGYGGASYFPSPVMSNAWINNGNMPQSEFNAAVPQLVISGLKPDSVYYVKMSSSFAYGTTGNPTQYTVAGLNMQNSQFLNIYDNQTMGITFQKVAPDASGKIRVYVNTTATTDIAMISGLQIISGSAQITMPNVQITSPSNGDILAEESNIVFNATATETGGTITKVEFYAGTAKIGEADAAPYTMTWTNPNEGHYMITAKATDGAGTTNTSTINISVESLTSFWSMTGNIGMNADSNFVGNVDSVRLAFRTRNIERMSIAPLGNVGIGTINPTAQLHTTGSVRLAGLKNDSTNSQPRVLVSDTSGNLFYRSASGLSRWIYSGGTLYDSVDNIAIGTSNPDNYKLAVNGTAIFTKVKVKTAGTWPDYVFEKGYALPGLPELEKYLAEHKHLPGIASQQEVQANGIDVGDHAAALLKKVEELTLYLIEQNKTLTEQNRQLAEQAKQAAEQKARLDAQQKEIDELKALIKAKH